METIVSAIKSDDAEVRGAVIENLRTSDLTRRVNQYRLSFNEFGEPELVTSQNDELGRRECFGMLSMLDLFKAGCNWVVWISPAGGMSKYPESRICVLKGEDVGGKVEFCGWGVCSDMGGEECLKLANNLLGGGGRVLGEIEEVDDLRSAALGFETSFEDLMVKLEDLVPISGVWQAIADGRVEANKVKIGTVVSEVLGGLSWSERSRMSDYQFQMFLEVGLQKRGIYLMAGGNHGGSVLGGEVGGAFNSLWLRMKPVDLHEGLKWCEGCQAAYMKKKGKCPRCGKE